MAFMLTKEHLLVLVAGNQVRVVDSTSGHDVARISCRDLESGGEADQQTKSQEQSEDSSEASVIPGQILAAAISNSGDLLALCDDYKRLRVWRITKEKCDLVCWSTVPRRSTALTFAKGDSLVLVADKNGDAYSAPVSPESGTEVEIKRILGHLGMLLDIKVSNCGKLVITCDRDEKIRVSNFPNTYNIENFHLAHLQFVYCICVPRGSRDVFVSGSGDGTAVFWSFTHEKPVQVIHFQEDLKLHPESPWLYVKCLDYHNSKLCVSFNNFPSVLVYDADLTPPVSASLSQRLDFSKSPWDVRFNEDGQLLVLLPEENPLRIFRLDSECGSFIPVDSQLSKSVNGEWDFFEPALKTPSLFSILEKAKVDNMKSYLETKEKRIAEGTAVRNMGGKKKSSTRVNSDVKKPKV